MSELTSNANSKFYIGPATDATTASALGALTFVAVNGIESLGEAGSTSETITAKFIGGGAYTRKRRGSRDNGSMSLVVFYNAADAGQIALKAAERSTEDSPYAFKIELNDAPAGGDPTTYLFKAIVKSAVNNFGSADDAVKVTFELDIDGEFFEQPASA